MQKTYIEIGEENIDVIKSLIQEKKSKTFIAKYIGCERRTLVKILKHYDIDYDFHTLNQKNSKTPNFRICNDCNRELDLNCFYVSKKKRSWTCKNCTRRKSKEFYDKKVSAVAEYKSNCGCAKCGETRPYVLEFHHRDPSQKDYTIANRARASLEAIMSEIQKCVILCSNCHQSFHHLERRNGINIEDFLTNEVVYVLK